MTQTKKIPWFLGIDLGTGSCKSVVVDEKARPLGFGVGDYGDAGLEGKWQERDPQALLAGLVTSVRLAVAKAAMTPENCAGLSIGGALHSIMALDDSDRPLTGLSTWVDGRAIGQARAIRETPDAPRLYEETGCPVHGMYPLYKIIWLRDEQPEIFQQARRFVSAKEYVLARLSGQYGVDYALASGSGLLNIHSHQWNERSLELAGLRPDQLSPLHSPLELLHGLNPELARQMGIPAHTPLVLGASDAANSSLGAGAAQPWQATCMVGTSGAFRVVTSRPVLDAQARSFCYVADEKHWLVGGAINNGGIALAWLRNLFNQAFPGLPPESRLSFDDVVSLASQVDTGAGGLICLPFFAGERSPNWNLNARALLFGMTLEHDSRHLALALLEGIAFRIKSLNEVLAELGLAVRQVCASGGFTKSEFWLQVMANVLNQELVLPVWGETSALGAAFWAMRAAGLGDDLEKLGDFVELGKSYQPIVEDVRVYDRLYPIFKELYSAAGNAFEQITQIQQDLKI